MTGCRSAVAERLRAAGCVFAEDEADLLLAESRAAGGLAGLVARRAAGEPLEHVLGWAAFRGLRIAVEPGVFVPRRRTEFLVGQAVARAALLPGVPVVVDLCCGSGALGAALAAEVGRIELYAADLDPVAVRCARRNLAPFRGEVFAGDLFAALPGSLRGRVGVLLANVPYVPSAELALLPAEARDHEPRLALDGGADGLDVLRRVAVAAPEWLAPGGCLLAEVGEHQAAVAAEILARAHLSARLAVAPDGAAIAAIGVLAG